MINVKKNLIGQRFGKLVVIGRSEDYISPSGNKYIQWICQCDCNSEPIIVKQYRLISGKKVDCGCEHPRMGVVKDLTGKRFGRLVADHICGQDKNGNRIWYCNCDCGNHVEVKAIVLKNGKTTSCGCERKEKIINDKINKLKKKYLDNKFGHVTVKEFDRVSINKKYPTSIINSFWSCVCDCRNEETLILTGNKLDKENCCCGKCAYKYYITTRPNRYDLGGEYGVGYANYRGKEKEFYFDKEDYDKIKNYNWTFGEGQYVKTKVKDTGFFMHRWVMGYVNEGPIIDHENRKPWDNRKQNLRECKQLENKQNSSINSNNQTGIIGVDYAWRLEKWRANITYERKRHYLGLFLNKEDAIKARLLGEIKYFKEGFEPQRDLFEKYGIDRNDEKGIKKMEQDLELKKIKKTKESKIRNGLIKEK